MKHLLVSLLLASSCVAAGEKPNVIFILADDIGYGDLGCYGATKIKTPNLDRMAAEGRRFTDGHCPSGTCTPTRYALLTGEYAWRRPGTGILPGNAALIIAPGRVTLPGLMKEAGYATGCVGKWHLGLGDGNVDWNTRVKPGPNQIGFDYSFIMPATGDRVPCVYMENGRVVGLDPNDPIQVSYGTKIGTDPTGKEQPELLTMKLSMGHDGTIVNGISRIGFMSGGQSARWKDGTMADEFATRAARFIELNRDRPFFLYLATQDIHVPRVPGARFKGSSGCGVRGDVTQEFDDTVGQILATLERLKLTENTLVIVTSDNGPVVNDGYDDGADRELNGHNPSGPFRGGKYSLYEAGTRVPFLVRWPGRVKPGTTFDGLFGYIDTAASLAALTGTAMPAGGAPDSVNALANLLGEAASPVRQELVVHDGGAGLALRSGSWKFIPVSGRHPKAELYDLSVDPSEKQNVSEQHADKVAELSARLTALRGSAAINP
jgi:arylsulfatase A-like enzyme